MRKQFFFSIPLSFFILLIIFPGTILALTWQADLTTRVFSPKIPLIQSRAKFYQKDRKIRIVPADSEEIQLYDFDRRVTIRIFPSDRIYFEKPLSIAKIVKAMKEAWIKSPTPFKETKILLRKDLFQEKKAALFLVVFSNKEQKAYALRWVTDDEAALPLRVIYTGSGRETIILDYASIEKSEIPPDYFDPPEDYLNLNPF